MNCAVFTVVYPGVENFFSELICSLERQSDKDFVFCVLNDGVEDLDSFFHEGILNVETLDAKGSPSALRKKGIDWIVSNGFKKIVFVDADDYIEKNRVEVTKMALDQNDIVCNDLILFGEKFLEPVSMLDGIFEEGQSIKIDDLRDGNCMGLTNTAIRSDMLSENFAMIPDEEIAFDWALFSMCLHAGADAVFTKATKTYYRQHVRSIASVVDFSKEQILKGIRIKRDHYRFLVKTHKQYASYVSEYEELIVNLDQNEELCERYCNLVKDKSSRIDMWWRSIKLMEELQ